MIWNTFFKILKKKFKEKGCNWVIIYKIWVYTFIIAITINAINCDWFLILLDKIYLISDWCLLLSMPKSFIKITWDIIVYR